MLVTYCRNIQNVAACEQCHFGTIPDLQLQGPWWTDDPERRAQCPSGSKGRPCKNDYVGALNARTFCAQTNLTLLQTNGCESCFDPMQSSDGWNLVVTETDAQQQSISMMRRGDWFTLILVAAVIAMQICNELRDVKLCQSLRQQRGAAQSPTLTWVKVALVALELLRQFVLVPGVTMTVNNLLLWRGTDALTVCFNTVAILFLLDVE